MKRPERTIEPDDPAQSRRFIEMAREVGADEEDLQFAEKVAAIARLKNDDSKMQKKVDINEKC